MADFPYSPTPASIKRFLQHIQSAGVPDKVSQKYLEKVGFKSKNDRYIIGVLKFIGLLGTGGEPTPVWQAYRNRTTAGATLAGAIRRNYGDLFKTFPDADRKDSEALRNYFSAHTKVADSTLGLIVQTFKTLASLADFEAEAPQEVAASPSTPEGGQKVVPARATLSESAAAPSAPAININIQLQLPATDDGTIYDNLFAALKKHLLTQP